MPIELPIELPIAPIGPASGLLLPIVGLLLYVSYLVLLLDWLAGDSGRVLGRRKHGVGNTESEAQSRKHTESESQQEPLSPSIPPGAIGNTIQ